MPRPNPRKRFLSPWKNSLEKPSIYHIVSRVVERKFVLGDDEREKFRSLMRMYENFTGCRVLSYCIMSNHFHILLEVPPMPKGGLSDEELLHRLSAIYSESIVGEIAKELLEARKSTNAENRVREIHERFTYRMHDLGHFMKTLLQRFTRWFNRTHERIGVLWEARFKSVLVESGLAAKTIAAYIDLNPVRAGMVSDPAQYRWSSYGEAIGGGAKGNGKKAREGLVRANLSDKNVGFDSQKWPEVAQNYRVLLGYAIERKQGKTSFSPHQTLPEISPAQHLRHRIRYFSDGLAIGGKSFINNVFTAKRAHFSPRRKDGARKMKTVTAATENTLWNMRDLRAKL